MAVDPDWLDFAFVFPPEQGSQSYTEIGRCIGRVED